jgi:hypothetical protein
MRTYNKHNVLLNFPRCRSILLLQTSKTDNNGLDIDAIYNLKLRKTQPNSTNSCGSTKLTNLFSQVQVFFAYYIVYSYIFYVTSTKFK